MSSILDVEDLICNAYSMTAILMDRLHTHFERHHENVTGHKNYYYLSDEDIECLLFAAGQLKNTINEAKTNYYRALNARKQTRKALPKVA